MLSNNGGAEMDLPDTTETTAEMRDTYNAFRADGMSKRGAVKYTAEIYGVEKSEVKDALRSAE